MLVMLEGVNLELLYPSCINSLHLNCC